MTTGRGYTFFSIEVPEGETAREWAKQYWDTYGFDYDMERSTEGVLAWPLEDAETDLATALEEAGIEFTTFEVDDLEAFFE